MAMGRTVLYAVFIIQFEFGVLMYFECIEMAIFRNNLKPKIWGRNSIKCHWNQWVMLPRFERLHFHRLRTTNLSTSCFRTAQKMNSIEPKMRYAGNSIFTFLFAHFWDLINLQIARHWPKWCDTRWNVIKTHDLVILRPIYSRNNCFFFRERKTRGEKYLRMLPSTL